MNNWKRAINIKPVVAMMIFKLETYPRPIYETFKKKACACIIICKNLKINLQETIHRNLTNKFKTI